MKILGYILIVVGVVALANGGFGYNRQKTLVDLGPIKATETEHHEFPIPPVAGAAALVGGLVLVFLPRRSTP